MAAKTHKMFNGGKWVDAADGKTLLARALPGIPPEMSVEESLDVMSIYSVADRPRGNAVDPLPSPPRPAPYDLSWELVGGNIPKPGEISLAFLLKIGIFISKPKDLYQDPVLRNLSFLTIPQFFVKVLKR